MILEESLVLNSMFPHELQIKNTMCVCLLSRAMGKNQKTPKTVLHPSKYRK